MGTISYHFTPHYRADFLISYGVQDVQYTRWVSGNGLDNELEITKDDLETSLIIPNRMSDKDLECLSAECLINPSDAKSKTRKIIEEEYGVLANLI